MKKVIVSVLIVMFLSGCVVHGKHKGDHKGKHKGSEQHKPRR